MGVILYVHTDNVYFSNKGFINHPFGVFLYLHVIANGFCNGFILTEENNVLQLSHTTLTIYPTHAV